MKIIFKVAIGSTSYIICNIHYRDVIPLFSYLGLFVRCKGRYKLPWRATPPKRHLPIKRSFSALFTSGNNLFRTSISNLSLTFIMVWNLYLIFTLIYKFIHSEINQNHLRTLPLFYCCLLYFRDCQQFSINYINDGSFF